MHGKILSDRTSKYENVLNLGLDNEIIIQELVLPSLGWSPRATGFLTAKNKPTSAIHTW